MNWSIAHFIFDADRGVLRHSQVEVVLEPKASALLAYFCQNDQRDLSRDELIEHVWHGQIVSDNAINRVVVMLRKALSDEGKPRQFIVTVPKVGYRFVGRPQSIDNSPSPVTSTNPRPGWLFPALGLFLLASALIAFYAKEPSLQRSPIAIEPVSRETGWQYDADLSPNEQHLLYSVSARQGNVLYLQHLDDGQLVQVSPDSGNASGGRWSHDGAYFVYIYHQGEACSFHKVTVDTGGTIVSNELLQTCNLNSDTTFALSLDDEILYFVERANSFSPYVAYALDMQEQQRWRLAQPLPTSFGNHYLDVHPTTGKVLLLSEPKPGVSAVYEIDVPGNEFKRIQSFDYDLYSAVWGHEDNTVVHPAEHPSYQLLRTDLTTGQSTVLVSDSRRISTPRRINNGRDYLFASYLYNRDIEVEGFSGSNFNSAVMDYLPELSNSGDQLAFVSKRAGFSNVFILNLEADELVALKSQDAGMTFYNLSWSPDDKKLAANTSKGIVIYDLDRESQHILPIDQLTYVVDWYSNSELTYSQYLNGQWEASLREIDGETSQPFAEGVLFVLTDADEHLYVDSGNAYSNKTSGQADIGHFDIAACGVRYISRFRSNIKFDGRRVFCPDPNNQDQLLVVEPGKAAAVFSTGFKGAEFYTVSNARLAMAKAQTASSDVMRTRTQPVVPSGSTH